MLYIFVGAGKSNTLKVEKCQSIRLACSAKLKKVSTFKFLVHLPFISTLYELYFDFIQSIQAVVQVYTLKIAENSANSEKWEIFWNCM